MNEFRRNICGINADIEANAGSVATSSLNATDDSKVVTELHLNMNTFYDDLNADDCSTETIEKIAKLVAELAKDGNFSILKKNTFFHIMGEE